MVEAFAVIGANYGDEGKGLVTNYLCREAKSKNHSVLNILTNGGCQRGHTVIDDNNNRIVFSHLGSGFCHSDIMFSKYYMINPMVFCPEYEEFIKNHEDIHKIYIDKNCTLTTPFDMYINRLVEDRRTKKHGSCGYGIWETVKRNEIIPIFWHEMQTLSDCELTMLLSHIRDYYFSKVLKEYEIILTNDEKEIFYSNILIENYINDIRKMQNIVHTTNFNIVDFYDTIVFENAQGLLLDKDLHEWSTPTKTGMTYIDELMKDYNVDVIPYYVTRSYLTKHGNGEFPGECSKEEINMSMYDQTNHPNKYQGTLRYGFFNSSSAKALYNRIKQDATTRKFKLVVTHINEYPPEYLEKYADYYSDNEKDIFLK